jgi:hypothetical protein
MALKINYLLNELILLLIQVLYYSLLLRLKCIYHLIYFEINSLILEMNAIYSL